MEFWIIQTLNALVFAMLLFLLCAGLLPIFGIIIKYFSPPYPAADNMT
jgi:hypothetical protein